MSGKDGSASISESDGDKVKKQIKNVEASIRARLLKIAKDSNRDFNFEACIIIIRDFIEAVL